MKNTKTFFKKGIFLFFCLTLLVPTLGQSAERSDYTINPTPSEIYYASTFDNLVFDFVVPDNDGYEDVLKALTAINSADTSGTGIKNLKLYADDKEPGFQGMGVDKDLGNGIYSTTHNYWYWDSLDEVVPVGGLRLFITIEGSSYISYDIVIQMRVHQLFDDDLDGEFDLGDRGVFVESDNDGSTDQNLDSFVGQLLEELERDFYEPKAAIDNVEDGQLIETDSFTITGQAREQGEATTNLVSVGIKNLSSGFTNWFDVENTGIAYSTWKYYWQNIENGNYELSVMAKDSYDNSGVSSRVLSAEVNIPEEEPEPEPEDPEDVVGPGGILGGDLIKAESNALYYFGHNSKRYVFPNEKTYKTWYEDFSSVKTITLDDLSSISIGGNITYRPGVKMVKITTDPKVYAVDGGGTLRWVTTEDLAISLYGENWNQMIEDIPDAFFTNYSVGEPIESLSDFDPEAVMSAAVSISVDKDLVTN